MQTSRRSLIRGGATLALGFPVIGEAMAGAQDRALVRTPDVERGPFYPFPKPADADADLSWVEGRAARARGEVIEVFGTVFNVKGERVPGAGLEIWQANAAGRYAHPIDPNPAPLDPNFIGYALINADAKGRYRITTVKPGDYPVFGTLRRPPHIHFDIRGRIDHSATQMFFPGEPLNAPDPVLAGIPAGQREAAFARPEGVTADGRRRFRYDIVLASG